MNQRLPDCPHRPPCPGCPHYGRPGLAPGLEERLETLAAKSGAAFEVVVGPRQGFRHRARLAVRGRAGSPKVGIFQRGTHRIVDIPECRTHHPLVNATASALKRAIRKTGVPPYAERSHRGVLRNVQVVVERSSRRVQVVLVGNGIDAAPLAPLASQLATELGDRLHSLWWNGQPEASNTILGPHWQRLRGDEAVCERIGGVQVFFPPGAFGQSNLDLADRLVERVASWVPDDVRVAEFYAGSGAIGLGLLRRCREVVFNERSEHGLRGLEFGLAALPELQRRRARVAPGAAEDRLAALSDAEVVIVDPPRRGLDEPLAARLAQTPPSRLVYVSCDLDSFTRDSERLLAGGRLQLRALTAFALFPHTEHLEIAARFDS